MSDICLPNYRLYIEGDFYKAFSNKVYYVEMLNFFDKECTRQSCGYKEIYDKSKPFRSSQVACKLGNEFNCNHPKHPDNSVFDDFIFTLKAENDAFKKAGITEGTVTYTCPKCGSQAVANSISMTVEPVVLEVVARLAEPVIVNTL